MNGHTIFNTRRIAADDAPETRTNKASGSPRISPAHEVSASSAFMADRGEDTAPLGIKPGRHPALNKLRA